MTQAEAFQAEVLIPTATSSAPLTLCYVFGNEPAVQYAFFHFSVRGVNGLTIVDHPDHSVNVILAGETLEGQLEAVGAAAGDKVLFVPRGVECSPENAREDAGAGEQSARELRVQ